MSNCEIRLSMTNHAWAVTVTIAGWDDYHERFPENQGGAMEGAATGILVAVRRLKERPDIIARGTGATYVQSEAEKQDLPCEIRVNQPNRGRPRGISIR